MDKKDIDFLDKRSSDYSEKSVLTFKFYKLIWDWLCDYKKDFDNTNFSGNRSSGEGKKNGYIL